jgi:nifR3 family TIM-barrel protein
MTQPAPAFHVGGIPIYGDTILSPMDGYSDRPFRGMARRLGSAMSYTEFINGLDIVRRHPNLKLRLAFHEWERPLVVQLYDQEVDRIVKAAQIVMERVRPDISDVNMGCAAKKIADRGAGAGLLREPEKIAEIFSRLTKTLDVPVTGKIRLGWDADSLNYLEVAHIIEDNGGQLVAVHGRTKEQAYGGEADWDAIAEVKQALSIPVIGNGDIKQVADIARMKQYTGCDAVMIARAAIGNPWIFAGLDRHQVSIAQVRETMLSHLDEMIAFYGAERGLVLFRKHLKQYVSPYPLTRDQRIQLLTCETPEHFVQLLDESISEKQTA